MNVYTNHHVTRMKAFVTKVHINECYMSQTMSLSRSTSVCMYEQNSECVEIYGYVDSMRYKHTWVWVQQNQATEMNMHR